MVRLPNSGEFGYEGKAVNGVHRCLQPMLYSVPQVTRGVEYVARVGGAVIDERVDTLAGFERRVARKSDVNDGVLLAGPRAGSPVPRSANRRLATEEGRAEEVVELREIRAESHGPRSVVQT